MEKKLTEIILSSTIHGISNIFRAHHILHKLMWIVSTIISCLVCGWFLINTFVEYYKFSVVTRIETIYEQPQTFPTISFCSFSDSKTTKDLDYLRNGLSLKNFNKTIKTCMFNYDQKCTQNPENFFIEYEDPEYGFCLRFNSGKNSSNHHIPLLNSTIGGMDDSLILTTSSIDFLVWIHNSKKPIKREHLNNHQGDINFITRGSEAHIIIEKTIESKLGEPHNSCLKDSTDFKLNKTLTDHIRNKHETYSHVQCLELCFDLNYIESNSCNCPNASIGNVWQNCYGTIRELNNLTFNCTMEFKRNFYAKKILEVCSNYCPQECELETYSVSVKSLISNNSESHMFFYYKSLSYTSITQEPLMNVNDLVSEIGGILGLFLGMSFLSFIEIFQFATEYFYFLKKHLTRKKQDKEQELDMTTRI